MLSRKSGRVTLRRPESNTDDQEGSRLPPCKTALHAFLAVPYITPDSTEMSAYEKSGQDKEDCALSNSDYVDTQEAISIATDDRYNKSISAPSNSQIDLGEVSETQKNSGNISTELAAPAVMLKMEKDIEGDIQENAAKLSLPPVKPQGSNFWTIPMRSKSQNYFYEMGVPLEVISKGQFNDKVHIHAAARLSSGDTTIGEKQFDKSADLKDTQGSGKYSKETPDFKVCSSQTSSTGRMHPVSSSQETKKAEEKRIVSSRKKYLGRNSGYALLPRYYLHQATKDSTAVVPPVCEEHTSGISNSTDVAAEAGKTSLVEALNMSHEKDKAARVIQSYWKHWNFQHWVRGANIIKGVL